MLFHTKDYGAGNDYWCHQQQNLDTDIYKILGILSYDFTIEEVLEHILQRFKELLQADAGAVYRLWKKEGMLHIQTAQGLPESYTSSMRVALGKGAVGKAILEQRTITVSKKESLLSLELSADLHIQQCKLLKNMFCRFNTLLAIPLITKNEIYGGIVLYYTFPHEFTENIHKLAQNFGDQAALAIENVRLFNEAKNKGVQEERLRMARTLHDSVVQELYSITLYTEASLRLLAAGDRETTSSHLSEIQETAIEALQEMRLLIFELRPSILELEGIIPALQARLDAVENRARVVTSMQIEGDINLSDQIEEVLYRIAQEALNNILKHAHAHTVTMKLSQNKHSVQLEISDDGIGFDLNSIQKNGGAGLRGIEERMVHIGGTVIIHSIPGSGTCIKASLEVQKHH
jgi:signal transduction histidine kinase